jgi:hypothetical protein
VLVAAVAVAIGIPIAQAVLRRRRDRDVADALPPVAAAVEAGTPAVEQPAITDAELLLRRAEDLARRGELDRATLTFLGAALRALDQRGVIRIARHRTNGEYVRGCKDDGVRRALRDIVREVERVQFGGEPTTADAVLRVATRAAALVRQTAVVATSLALLLACAACAGCTLPSGGGLSRAADPAGDEMLVELLKRQGIRVSRLGGSLATLPLPKEDQPSPLIVIDMERIALEDDARAHLARWVEAGGTLVLAGRPAQWPGALGATLTPGSSQVITVVGAELPPGRLARPSALAWPGESSEVASLSGGETYAAIRGLGEGKVLGLANDDLLTNAALSRRGNPGVLVAILGHVEDIHEIKIARPEDGVSPPSNPIAALNRAGLGLGLWHALAATLLAFLAVGTRLARPRPTPPPQRRAFTEHVEATGALYARARIPAHALAAYARYADERLRAKMPRAMTDPAAFLASRANADPATCAALWERATAARSGAPPRGDELATLRHLSQLVTEATRAD